NHFASETVAPDEDNDKTVLSNTTQIQENTAEDNDNDKTVLAAGVGHNAINTNIAADIESNAGSDATIIDDQTRIATPFASKTSQVDLPESSFNTTNSAQTAISSQIPQSSGQQPGKKLEPGAIINNRFVLEKLLGRGGMGSVFKARDLRKEEANDSNSHIAIKFLNEDFKQHPQALISLQRESKKSQTLAHPNIITVHDFDRDGDTVYMTMEYLDGAPLDEFLVNHKHTGIEKDVAIKIIDDISQALAYAHKNNIVHSDFKPGNVFITTDGTAKILDFGIARAVQNIGDIDDTGEKKSSAGAEKTVFDAGELGGLTPTYASCEMLEGKQPSASDDIYALGCVAYELLTGAHPFSRVTATRARDSNLAPEIIKSLDRKQSNALVHTLQFSKDARTEDAQEFIREFFIRKQNSKILIATLSVAALLLIGIGIKYFLDYRQQIAIENLIAEVQQGKTEVIENAIPDLRALEGETRETVLSDVRPVVIRYYAKKALPLADQSKGLYNFPAALAVLSDAKKLYPDSAQVNELIIQITNNQNQLLNTLGLQIDKFLQKGKLSSAIYNNDIQDIIDLLKIAAPDSHLLKDTRIQLAYIREIKAALKTDNLDDAKILIKSGLSLFNNDKEILALKENLKEREAQIIEDQQLAALQEQLSKEGKKITEPVRKKAIERQVEKLNGLLKTGFQDSTWLNEVQSTIVTLDVFAKKPEEKQLPLRDRAATLIIQQSREKRRAGEIAEARSLLKHAYKIAPALTALAREERALTVAERKQQQ
ncbi:MAG: protein kinase, partial [Gammaproteobacteria bacterium]|nr:protein kinase [Gammaproteobacteria bacterium]